MAEFSKITDFFTSQDCFVVEVDCDNSLCLNDIRMLAFSSHHLVKNSHSLGVAISLQNKGKKHCKLFVSNSTGNTRRMAEPEIKVNEENYYSSLRGDLNFSLKKICLSSVGTTTIIAKQSNCSENKANNIIKIPVIFIPYQPFIGDRCI